MNHNAKQFVYLLFIFLMYGCASVNPVKQNYTFEDKQVFELIERLKKNANDDEAAKLLPEAYNQALEKRTSLTEAKYYGLAGGDRHIALANEWKVMQDIYQAVKSTPVASKLLPDIWDPALTIQKEYNRAADEYYNEGLTFLNHGTRAYAQKAYDNFSKANSAVPGYKDVADKMQLAKSLALIKVVVNAVDYYSNPYSHWGFQNDWMQQQIVRDLNFRSYNNVQFYTNWQARSQNIYPDKMVDIIFTRIFIGQLFTDNSSYTRTAQIKTGETKSIPPKPVYQTVTAKVFVTKRYMQSNASLQCRIYDAQTNFNNFYDNFPNTYNWSVENARYTGDSRALTAEDWRLINNSGTNPPGRNEIADQLLRSSYNMLLSRINSRVSF